jgi:hypothetical protein
MIDTTQASRDITVESRGGSDVEWRTRYEGVVAVAHVGSKAVAGISGPWSDRFALTWWERPAEERQLALFDSLEAAKREVEDWASSLQIHAAEIAAAFSVAMAKPSETLS